MKLLRKTHFWQDKRTWIEIEGEFPSRNERGYAEEGKVSVKIGDENGLKASFKLSADEARALRDVISLFSKKHDSKMAELMSTRGEYSVVNSYNKPSNTYSSSSIPKENVGSYSEKKDEPMPSFEIFDIAEKREEETKEKPKLNFYY
ncbi:hypothetical protein DRO91_10080 [Candidatus Heimdallarchaeota archaeon]|nr:MAG: hypothetical protein DRO91_10080 [Candidatus Heimdallarchaeota archaeon]